MDTMKTNAARRVFMILSPRSLGYARHALNSLLTNALEPIQLHLITDSSNDKELLIRELDGNGLRGSFKAPHRCAVFAKSDLDDHESDTFGRYTRLRFLRNGHPCWRKITDPLLLSGGEGEMVLLDPDLYFPNKFRFEATPDRGLLLMWQGPSCLLPTSIVDTAIAKGISLAHHVDIGVAHWRAPVDLDWLDWLVNRLGIEDHPGAMASMHVEAIIWAAIAMHVGGGYLPTEHWRCWKHGQWVRLLRKLGVPGSRLLRHQPFSTIKCFHAGGEAKHWLEATCRRGWLHSESVLDSPGVVLPFVELTFRDHHRQQALKSWLKKLGYYSMFQRGELH
jgi:hypothetical protein